MPGPDCWPRWPMPPGSRGHCPRPWPRPCSGADVMIRAGCCSTWPSRWPTAGRRCRTWPCCATSRRCSGRWPRHPRPAGWWTTSMPSAWTPSAAARATARAAAWKAGLNPVTSHGPLILDFDATLLDAASEKERRSPTYKKGFGFFPLLCFLDATNEALAGILRPGNAGANTAADHIDVLELALAQLPVEPDGPTVWPCSCAATRPGPATSSSTHCGSGASSSPSASPSPRRCASPSRDSRRRPGPRPSGATARSAREPRWPSSPVST